ALSFFFSSRRRHTRFSRDWSSDVCSSDLKLALHELEGADRRTELLALMDVGDHHIHAGLHDAKRSRCKNGALIVEARHENAHALIDLAEHIFFRHFAIFKHKLCRVRAAHTELVELLR